MHHFSFTIPCFADASKLRLLAALCMLGLLVPTAVVRAELKPLAINSAQSSSQTDDNVAETATIQLTTPTGLTTDVTVTEESPASPFLTAILPAAKVPAGSVVRYGFGYLGHSATAP
jgi:hypothetical protein